MKFPILFKKGMFFLWYRNHWINLNLEIAARGGGVKGLKAFVSGINKCRKGKHSFHTVFLVRSMSSCVRCAYCHEVKRDEYS